ncbi:MAG: polysaccharide biosynthesis tyrosine autokinase [Actinobacteria bacterium]|nr:polysaccharide biosynthesis tyrosine autokinase [Actinomycetota bacterium]NDE12906.1 polysaccharide biosynthesis tyrosine autokinase [Actinomycetota bacterium]
MELVAYWRLLMQSRRLISVTTLCGLLVSFLVTMSMTPIYKSSAQLFVSTPASAVDISTLLTGSSFSQQRVKSYAQIINSPVNLGPVVKELKLKITAEELSKNITASAPLDTVLISLTVNDTNPKRAARIANAVAQQFGITVKSLELQEIDTESPIKVSIAKFAVPPTAPSSPKKSINYLLGLLLGFGLGFGIASLRKLLDNTVKSEDDLGEIPLLAAIGFDLNADEKPLITQIGRYAARTEAFRTLRTNLKHANPGVNPKSIVISSALPNEGKSTSAINIAISLSQSGEKVLLVEADLRRPKIPIYLEFASKVIGLSELLSSPTKLTWINVKKHLRKHPEIDLQVLTSGRIPPNPAELLESGRFRELMTILKSKFDYIIIDCPPLLPITDAAIVAAQTDGAILVSHAGTTKIPHYEGARDAIRAVGAVVLGVILNKIPEDAMEYEYGYKYGYPKYYGYSGKPYDPLNSSERDTRYAPSKAEVDRMNEDEFVFVKGKRFKEELLRDRNKI